MSKTSKSEPADDLTKLYEAIRSAEAILADEQLCLRCPPLAEGCRALLDSITVRVAIVDGDVSPVAIPPGLRLEVRNYDTDSGAPENLEDENGQEYFPIVYAEVEEAEYEFEDEAEDADEEADSAEA